MKSKKPAKQRKSLYQAPHHLRRKYFSSALSDELKSTYKTNSIPIRVGDTVKIMRGDRRGYEGKVSRVDRKDYRIFIEGITREKADGTTVSVPIHPSKVMITRLNLEDKWRKEILNRKTVEEVLPTEPEKAGGT